MQIMHLTSDDSNTDSPAAHTIENATTAVIEREESHGENAIFGDLEALDRKDSSSLSNPGRATVIPATVLGTKELN